MHKKSADVNKIPLFGQIYRLCRHKRSSTSTHPDTACTIWSWWRWWKAFYGYWHVAKASNGMIIRLYIKCTFPTKCQHGIYFIIWDDEMSVYFIIWDDLVYFLLRSAFAILSLQKSDRRQDFNLWPFHQFVFCLSKKLVGLLFFLSARSDFHLSPLKSSQLYQFFFFCRMEKFSSSVKLQSGRLWAIFAAVISCIRAKSCTKFAFKLNITFSKHTLSS